MLVPGFYRKSALKKGAQFLITFDFTLVFWILEVVLLNITGNKLSYLSPSHLGSFGLVKELA